MPWRGWEGGFRERGEAAAAQPGKDSRGQDGRDGRGQPARGTHPRFTRDPDSEASGARGASACPPPRATGCGKHRGRAVRSRCHRVHSGGRRSLPRSRVGLLVTLRVPPGAGKTEPTPSAALPAFAPLPPPLPVPGLCSTGLVTWNPCLAYSSVERPRSGSTSPAAAVGPGVSCAQTKSQISFLFGGRVPSGRPSRLPSLPLT